MMILCMLYFVLKLRVEKDVIVASVQIELNKF